MARQGLPTRLKRFIFDGGWLVPILTVAAAVVCYHFDPLPLQALRNAAFDQYQRWDDRTYKDNPVRVIDIDDESLTRLGQFPWPRNRIAELLRRLQEAGAASIAFDIVFAEPDRTSPAAILKTWKPPAPLRGMIASLPDHDALLAKQVAQGRTVLGHVMSNDLAPPTDFHAPYVIRSRGPSPAPYLHSHRGTVAALPNIQAAAAGHGSFNFDPGADGVVRKAPLFLRLGDEIVPSLAMEALRVGVGSSNYLIITSEEGAGIESVRVGQYRIPATSEGEIWIRFTRGWQARTIPAWKVLAGEVPDDEIKGRILFVGTSAKALADLRFNPLGGAIPGVEAHAHVLDQILADDHLIYPNWAPALELGVIIVLGLLVGFVAMHASALVAASVVGVIVGAAAGGAWYLYSAHGLLLDPATPALALVITFVVCSLYHHVMSERRQRWVREAFARYVSPNRVQHIVDNPDALELGGTQRECSFVFTDLAGFTTLMEKLGDPTKAVLLLNEYLDNMIEIAFRHGGTLDRIVGDAVAIMFSAPVELPDHPQQAVHCAEEMYHFATKFSEDAHARGVPFGITRIGVHTGEVTVGNFGGKTMFDYRALGDPVNTAARLEQVNKFLGTMVCISEDTMAGTHGVPMRPVGRLVLKGKALTLAVFQPLFSTVPEDTAPLAEYNAAYAQMVAQDPEAEETFARLALRYPRDPLIKLHLKRLLAGETGETVADRRGAPKKVEPAGPDNAGPILEPTEGVSVAFAEAE